MYPTEKCQRLELSFRTVDKMVLDKVVFFEPSFTAARVSICLDTHLSSPAYGSFQWDSAIQAMALLLVKTAKVILFTKLETGLPTVFSRALIESYLNRDSWLLGVFGHDAAGIPIFSRLFWVDVEKQTVTLNAAAIAATSLTIVVDDKELTTPFELASLAKKLERVSRRLEVVQKLPSSRENAPSPTKKSRMTDEMRHMWSMDNSQTLLSALSEKLNRSEREASIDQLNEKLKGLIKHDLVIHNLQHTQIELINKAGDARYRFTFEIQNAGINPIVSRTHQFWFGVPQGDIAFECRDSRGENLRVNLVHGLPHHRQINIRFPSPLGPLEKYSYTVEYEAAGNGDDPFSVYTLSPRTVTRLMRLTVDGSFDFDFERAYVTHETRDGFLRDDPPQIIHTKPPSNQRIHWECQRPELGDLIRTYWNVVEQSVEIKSSPKAIPQHLSDQTGQ